MIDCNLKTLFFLSSFRSYTSRNVKRFCIISSSSFQLRNNPIISVQRDTYYSGNNQNATVLDHIPWRHSQRRGVAEKKPGACYIATGRKREKERKSIARSRGGVTGEVIDRVSPEETHSRDRGKKKRAKET